MVFVSIFLLTVAYSYACLCLGVIFLHLFPKKDNNDQVTIGIKLITAYLLGQGMLANFWLLLAVFGWFLPAIVKFATILLATGGILSSFKESLEFFGKVKQAVKDSLKDTWGWKIISGLTTLLCLLWITSLGRSPYGDGASFYLAIAKVVAESHHLFPLPGYENLTSIGLQGEMHFAALMSLGSSGAALLFSWPTIVAGSFMLLAIAKQVGINRRGQWMVLAMLFTSSAVVELSGSGKTDLFATALGFAAYYWAIEIKRADDASMAFWLTGLFSGLALIAKLSYVLTFIPSITIIIIWSYTTRRQSNITEAFLPKQAAGHFGILMSGILIAVIPHFVKNYVLFNNALAPFGAATTGWQDRSWNGPLTTHRILFTIPLALTFGNYWAQIGNLSPLLLIFSPLILLVPKPRNLLDNPLFTITFSVIVGISGWFILRPSILAPRYFMACLLLSLLPIAKTVEYISRYPAKFRLLSNTALIITILTGVSTISFSLNRVYFPKNTFLYLTGKMTECEIEARFCGLITIINTSAKPGERVFIDNARYWLRSDLIQCALTSEEINSYLDLDTSEQRWAFIYGRGFDLIPIVNTWNPVENIVREDMKHIPSWLAITKATSGTTYLLKLTSLDATHRSLTQCGQKTLSIWNLFNK